jgi:hypothetical protein
MLYHSGNIVPSPRAESTWHIAIILNDEFLTLSQPIADQNVFGCYRQLFTEDGFSIQFLNNGYLQPLSD